MTKWDVARALKASDLSAPAKLIMWDLLDSADADTAVIPEQFTPSLNDLVRTTSLSRSTVKRELNRLEGDGWVVRDRPDPVKARTEFARTGYRLAVPPRPTEGLGPDPRPTVDPGLGPEGTEARPTVGRIPFPDHPNLDQSLSPRETSDHRQDDGERELIEWIRTRHRPGGKQIDNPRAYLRTVTANGDLPELLATMHAEQAGRPTPAAELPPHCGLCGDLEALANPAARNPRFRYQADGTMCHCHPDMTGESTP